MKKLKRFVLWLMVFTLTFTLFSAGCSTDSNSAASTGTETTDANTATNADTNAASTADSGPVSFEDLDLPEFIAFGTYDVGTATFAQVAGLCEGILQTTGIKTRQIVSGTDFGRMIPVRSGTVQFFLATSNTASLAVPGRSPFNTTDWGPQPLREVWGGFNAAGLAAYVPKDSDINSLADLKGKRVPYQPGNDSANFANEAFLRYAGLTWDDVEKVNCTSPSDAYAALAEGRADVCTGGTSAAKIVEMEQTMGLKLLEFDPNDAESWAKLYDFAPTGFYPKVTTIGACVTTDNPKNVLGFIAPILMTYGALSDDVAYAMAKAIDTSYDVFVKISPDLAGWKHEEAIVPDAMVVPFHDGAVKYFKEMGYWTDELQAKQDELLEREAMYADLWAKALDGTVAQQIKSSDFPAFWDNIRKEATGY